MTANVADAFPASTPATAVTPLHGATSTSNLLWFDGELIDMDMPQAGLTTHAMHYGSGVFEGIRSYATASGAAVFRLPDHLERMRKGAHLLGMTFDIAQAMGATLQTLRSNRRGDAYIRPLAWVGEGGFGLDVAGHTQHLMVATTATQVHMGGSNTRLTVSPWRRNPADALPPLKLCGGYINSILAKREAKERGFDEALFVDADGMVVECTGANVFMVNSGRVTAVEHRDALPGITRDTLIQLTGAETRAVSLSELQAADEVFACGTAAEVTRIAELDGHGYGDDRVTSELSALYARVVRGEEPGYAHWLTAV